AGLRGLGRLFRALLAGFRGALFRRRFRGRHLFHRLCGRFGRRLRDWLGGRLCARRFLCGRLVRRGPPPRRACGGASARGFRRPEDLSLFVFFDGLERRLFLVVVDVVGAVPQVVAFVLVGHPAAVFLFVVVVRRAPPAAATATTTISQIVDV